VKKTMAAPVMTPGMPFGKKGFQFVGSICRAPTTMNNTITAILITTMTLFAFALSFTPRASIQVSSSRISSDAKLM
jgi:hypothetical protein